MNGKKAIKKQKACTCGKGTLNSVGIIVIIAAAAIIVLGVSLYKYYQSGNWWWEPVSTTKDQNTGWKMHANVQYGFEFKYPGDWSITNSMGSTVSIWNPKDKKYAGGALGILIADFRANFCGLVSECINELNQSNGTDAKTIKDFVATRYPNYKEIIIDGEKAYEWVSTSATYDYTVYIEHADGIYILSAPSEDYVPKINPVVIEIIKTFKFTK